MNVRLAFPSMLGLLVTLLLMLNFHLKTHTAIEDIESYILLVGEQEELITKLDQSVKLSLTKKWLEEDLEYQREMLVGFNGLMKYAQGVLLSLGYFLGVQAIFVICYFLWRERLEFSIDKILLRSILVTAPIFGIASVLIVFEYKGFSEVAEAAIESTLFLSLMFGVYRRSRIAAISGVVITFLFIIMEFVLDIKQGILLLIIWLYLFTEASYILSLDIADIEENIGSSE